MALQRSAVPWRAVIFDLDGTLVHSLPDLHRAVNTLLGELGLPTLRADAVRGMVGQGAARLIARAVARASDTPDDELAATARFGGVEHLRVRFLEVYGADPVRDTRPYDGLVDVVRDLHAAGVSLGVCTNKPEDPSRAILRGLDLAQYFSAVVGGDTTRSRKPDPAPLREVLAQLGNVPADAAVFIGDASADVGAARAVGMPVVIHRHGYADRPVEEMAADAIVDAFADLPGILDRLRRGPGAGSTSDP